MSPFCAKSFCRKKKRKALHASKATGKERGEIVHIARSIVHIVHVELIRLTRAKDRQGETEREGEEERRGEREERGKEEGVTERSSNTRIYRCLREPVPPGCTSLVGVYFVARAATGIYNSSAATAAAATDKVDSAAGSRPPSSIPSAVRCNT